METLELEADSPDVQITQTIEQLASLVRQMKMYLPKVVSPDVLSGYAKVLELEEECNSIRGSLLEHEKHKSLLSRKCDSLMMTAENDKKENIRLRQEVASMNELLAEQASFCSTVGSTTCNLLWKMSHCAGAVDSILTGNMLVSFLQLANSSFDGFLETCENLVSEDSAEVNFILAIAGVLTNIFATSSGRDYLMTCGYGTAILDQYIGMLARTVKSERLKNIVLMAVYNISISQSGLEMVATRPGLSQALTQILTCSTTCGSHLQALKVVQSVAAECQNSFSAQEFISQISDKILRKFLKDQNPEVRAIVQDILIDTERCQREP